jgi:hypothetical protein
MQPTATPIATEYIIPTITVDKVKTPVVKLLMIAVNITIATPSLKSDSPSMINVSLLFTPKLFKVSITEIGSVGEIIVPNNNPSNRFKPKRKWVKNPIRIDERKVPTRA